MNLFEEEILKQPKKKKKTIKPSTILAISIVILLILCIAAIVGIMYLKNKILTINMDGKNVPKLKEILIMEENNKVYFPIKRLANYLGYDAYNGDYITLSEDDITKCYIESEEEMISFTLNSNVVTKKNNEGIRQIKVIEPIKEINGELCLSENCTEDVFNFKFYYNKESNKIIIQTLDYLYGIANENAIQNGYIEIPETIQNKLSVLENMLIVKSSNGYYGVVDVTNMQNLILETKYDKINYIMESSEFLVESNGKKGIITKNKKTKIEMIYESIQKVNDAFYIVKYENLYGILDKEGERMLHPEYQQIGIEVDEYSKNGVTNGYIFYDSFVPVKKNGKWALFDMQKNSVTDFQFDSFGCTDVPNTSSRAYGVLLLQDYNLIVGCKDGKYNLIDIKGEVLLEDNILEAVYIRSVEGKNKYYVSIDRTEKELEYFLQEKGITKTIN